MKICLLSDTHSHLDDSILKQAQWSDEIWHAGDIGENSVLEELESIKKVRGVYGNIDGHYIRSALPEVNTFEIQGLKFMMVHIGGYPPKYNKYSKSLILEYKPDVFVTGHSHILKVMRDKAAKLIYLNPGAAGQYGFHKKRTLLRFKIELGSLIDLEIVELGLRGR